MYILFIWKGKQCFCSGNLNWTGLGYRRIPAIKGCKLMVKEYSCDKNGHVGCGVQFLNVIPHCATQSVLPHDTPTTSH
jgi:hypothetical protein